MSKSPKKKRKKLATKAVLGLIFVIVFIVVFVCIGITWRYIKVFDDSRYGAAFTLTHTASKYIDSDKAAEYYKSGKTDEYYQQVQSFLKLMQSEGELDRLYVFVPSGNELVTLWDTNSSGGKALGARQGFDGEFKDIAMSSYSVDSETNVYINDQVDNKMVVTAFSPVLDKSGKTVAIVASEFKGENIIIKIVDFNLATLAIVLVSSIIPIIIYYRKTKKGVLVPINRLNSAAKEMVDDLESEKLGSPDIHTGDEIEELSDSFEQMNVELRDYIRQLRLATAEKERIGAELNMAKDIQAAQLPSDFPAFPDRKDFDIDASMTPAKEVGGDFYDFFLVDDDHLCMVMADVSGKGVPAALFMMASKIILANYAKMGKTPSEILSAANSSICSRNREDMFVTAWLGILEISTGKLTAANAGHEYPVLMQPDGKFELYKDKHGFVIGGMAGLKYKEYTIDMKPGSKLFLYTDGVPEATDAEKQLFGNERMVAALNEKPNGSPQEILKTVRSSVDAFVKDAEQFDDLTMLCLEYKG